MIEALAQAMRQWRSYAMDREEYDLECSSDAESKLYQGCKEALQKAEAAQ